MDNGKELWKIFESLLFPKIFQTFRISIQPKSILIAFVAVAAIFLSGWLMDFSNSVVCGAGGDNELNIYLTNPDYLPKYIEMNNESGKRAGVFATFSDFSAQKFNSSVTSLLELNLQQFSLNISDYCRAVRWAYHYHPVYGIIFALIKLAVIAVAGGAICRFTSLRFAQGQRPGLFEVLNFSIKKFLSFFAAPLVLLGVIIGLGIFIIILGLIANIPYAGELIMGILFAIALFLGALIAIIAIGAAVGFNLMFPTIAYEGTDCFEAISRSLSYVYTKPWRMAFYSGIALFYGSICYLFVRFFAFVTLFMTRLFLDAGVFVNSSGKEVDKLSAIWPKLQFMDFLGHPQIRANNWSESIAAFLVYLGVLVIAGLVIAFVISFYFTANTIIYSLMRNRVDGTRLDDIYIYSEDEFAQQKIKKAARQEQKTTEETIQNEDEQTED
jgi:hypothetical protein